MKILRGTPTYDGLLHVSYNLAIIDLMAAVATRRRDAAFVHRLIDSSLVARARTRAGA